MVFSQVCCVTVPRTGHPLRIGHGFGTQGLPVRRRPSRTSLESPERMDWEMCCSLSGCQRVQPCVSSGNVVLRGKSSKRVLYKNLCLKCHHRYVRYCTTRLLTLSRYQHLLLIHDVDMIMAQQLLRLKDSCLLHGRIQCQLIFLIVGFFFFLLYKM